MRLALRIAAFILPSTMVTLAIGQTTLPQDIVGSTRPLSSEQRSAVEEFASDQMTEMANGDPTEVVAARNTLVQTARRAGVTGVFLRAYSNAILPQATAILGAAAADTVSALHQATGDTATPLPTPSRRHGYAF